jgi:uncharacterized membrane protein
VEKRASTLKAYNKTMELSVSIDINAPVDKAYQLFSDIKNIDKNLSAIDKIEILESNPEFVGTRWRETRTEFGRSETVEMWVTNAKKDEFYEVESDSHGVHYYSRYDFEPITGNSTKVSFTFRGTPQTFAAKLMSLMAVFFKGATKKLFLKDMQELKTVLESK